MRGQGSSSSGESAPPNTTFLNPAGGVLANLFGVPTRTTQGGLSYGGRGSNFSFANPTLGAGSGFENIGRFLDLRSPYEEQLWGAGYDTANSLEDFIGEFNETSLPALANLTATGAPVDVDPLVRKTMTDVAEMLSPSSGFYNSDLAAEALRQGSELRVGAEESARDRQLTALALAPSAAGTGSSLAEQLLGLGEAFNMTMTSPGRAVTALQLLAGLQPTGAISRGNISESESKSGGGGLLWA